MGFIKINNRKNFVVGEIEKLHPQSSKYIKYWKLHKKRCIEGLWSLDDKNESVSLSWDSPDVSKEGKWRWMPGNLYFYINFGTIELNPKDGSETAPKIKARPDLRDFEWEFMYNWMECRGFSGFENDEKYSCDRRILKLEELKNSYKEFPSEVKLRRINRVKKRMRDVCFTEDGETKEFIPAREYLRKLHDKPLGLALFYNEAQDLMLLGARGGGKSYLVGVGVLLHEFLFDGIKVYIPGQTIPRAQICIGAALTSKSSEILEKFTIGHDNLPGEWAPGTVEYRPSPFRKKTSGTLKPNNVQNPYRWEYEAKIGREVQKKGSGTSLKHICYKDNSEAAAGGRYSVHGVEEVGLLGNVLTVHGSNEATMMKDGTVKFGSCAYIGTGGNVEKIQEAEKMFRDPSGFSLLAFEDEWEGAGKIGWFVPAYYMDGNFKDENGNTFEEDAKANYEDRRLEKARTKDPSALSIEMMNYPLVPSEMFLNAHGAMFPQAMLKEQLAQVLANPHKYQDSHWYVDLVWNNKGDLEIKHVNGNTLEQDFPINSNKNRPGVIEIFEMPKKDHLENIFSNRYIQGTDTYDDDESVTNSLGSTWILDTWTDRIVAEYTGRRGSKEFYEICRKLNIFYRTAHNYEKNKKGLYTYYDNKNSTHLLCDTPASLKDVADITISKVGNQSKGTHASTPIIAYGLRLILDWLLEPAYGEENQEILNLHKIKSVGLLRELINYNPDGNFDRISALIMLMILKEERVKYIEKKQQQKVKDLAVDDFFNRNFNRHNSKEKDHRYIKIPEITTK